MGVFNYVKFVEYSLPKCRYKKYVFFEAPAASLHLHFSKRILEDKLLKRNGSKEEILKSKLFQ